jgi:hypothetical protein
MQTSVPGVHKYQNPRKTKHLPDSRAEPKRDSACSIQLVYLEHFSLGGGSGFDKTTTCGLNLGWLSPSALKVSKNEESTPYPLFIDKKGFEGTWTIWLTMYPPKEFKCTGYMVTDHRLPDYSVLVGQPLPILMQDEDGADRTGSALKTAIRLCGGKDEPY